ncbi:MAG TPA: carboxypeptidase regulatory-like domain-containing protein [Verrucomicrobiae bacterium]|nr:carboxypeptidase regulatory-like domain-containing protein [Verrucomicrobiae bacterium]
MIKTVLKAAPLILCLFLLAIATPAQTIVTGGINGTITDASGAVVPGVALTLTNNATGDVFNTTSTATGGYVFSLLKPGDYTLKATKSDFKTISQKVTVLLGQSSTVNLAMELGASTTTVEVTGEGQLLQTENANIATTFDTRTVQNVPNPGNDITYVAQTAPGVSMNTSSMNGYGNFSAFGLPGTSNLFTINGNDYNDPFLNLNNSGASNLLLGANDVQEVAVVSNGYTGQYGRMAGAQIDYTSRSGTNNFHGSANYYWTGSALNDEDYFLKASGQPKPFQNNNQWAADFGGPIKKDKAYFFVDTEGLRYVLATATQSFLPTPAFQSYVLSQIPGTAVPFYQQAFALYNGAKGAVNAVPQAGTCPGIGGAANALPGGSTDCLGAVTLSGAAGNQEWLLIGRVDYSFSDNDKIFGRVKFDRGTQPTYADPINPAFNAISHQPQDEGQLNWTHIFNPSIANNFIFSDLWYSAIFQSPNVTAANAVFPEILCSANTSMSCLGATGGEFPEGFFFPQGRNVEQYQFVDDLSIEKGKNAFKMGINFRRDDISDYRASELTNPWAVNTSLAGFATDAVDTSTSQNFPISFVQPIAIYSFGAYFQDELRLSEKFKLTLALRADRNSGGACQHDCASLAAMPFQQLSHNADIPFNQMIDTRTSILRDVEAVVFQPRIGFAWTPKGQDTVIRGGVGLFSDLYPGTILDNITTNFPQVLSFSVPGGTVDPNQPGSGASIVQGCNTSFRNAFNSGQTLAQYSAAAPTCAAALPPLYDVPPETYNPKFIEWNLEVQHTLSKSRMVSFNYVGNHGYDILLVNPYLNAFCTTAICGGGFTSLPLTAPDARVTAVQQLTNNGFSNYQGFVASIQQNLWHGLTARFNYTFSHSLDNVSNGGVLPYSLANSVLNQINPTNPNQQYASSDYDARHQLSANYVWDLPIHSGNHWADFFIGGWQVAGTFFYRSGLPFSIEDGQQALAMLPNNLTVNGGLLATVLYTPAQGQPTAFGSGCASHACFTTNTFATPTDFNAYARNAFRGPGYFNTDMNLKKTFRIRERTQFMVGANAFNILNHPNFQNPIANNLSSAFGTINAAAVSPTTPYGAFASAAEGMRIVQVFAKLSF